MIARIFLGLLVLLAAACRRPGAPSAPSAAGKVPRDVVLITIDTLRADAVGFEGNTRGATPNLDRFAKEGRTFPFAHAHNVVTLPSHANILTGLYPYQHGVRDNAGFRLDEKPPTLAADLKQRGFATGAFVAAFPLDSRYGLSRGFDTYEETYRSEDEPLDFRIQESPGTTVVAEALEWYRREAGKPRFLWVHLYDPHAPYAPPPPFREKFSDDLYLGDVAAADAALAPLLEEVRGSTAAALLIVTSDHGEARGDHGELTHGLFAYEATLRVPLLLWGAGVSSGRDQRPARHIDIAPTILAAVGATKTADQSGRSLLEDGTKDHGATYFESLSASVNRGWAPLRGILSGSHKYVDLPIPELYDLENDPKESRNLAGESSDALRRSRKLLEELPRGESRPGAVNAEEAARLRSLGYLAGGAEEKTTYGPQDDPKNLIGVDRQLHDVVDLFQRGQAAQATAIAQRVVAENPKMPIAYQQLAFLLAEWGDLAAAIRVYEKAAGQGLRGETMERRQALLLAEAGQPAKAAELLAQYSTSEDGETLNALGIALTDLGRPQEGLPLFQRALALDSGSALSYQNVGIALLHLGKADEARQSLEKSLAINQHNARAWNALGVAWMRLNAPEKALDAWDRCVAVNPDQYDALYNIGLVAMRVGDRARARQALERFARGAPPSRYAKDLEQVRAALAVLRREAPAQ